MALNVCPAYSGTCSLTVHSALSALTISNRQSCFATIGSVTTTSSWSCCHPAIFSSSKVNCSSFAPNACIHRRRSACTEGVSPASLGPTALIALRKLPLLVLPALTDIIVVLGTGFAELRPLVEEDGIPFANLLLATLTAGVRECLAGITHGYFGQQNRPGDSVMLSQPVR